MSPEVTVAPRLAANNTVGRRRVLLRTYKLRHGTSGGDARGRTLIRLSSFNTGPRASQLDENRQHRRCEGSVAAAVARYCYLLSRFGRGADLAPNRIVLEMRCAAFCAVACFKHISE
jgi:hypothetical protein